MCSLLSSEDQRRGDKNDEDVPWPTNGGPLGCLLGAIAGILIGGFLGTTLFTFYRFIGIPLTVLLTIGLAVIGWQIGRKVFREYKPPRRRGPMRGGGR
jgi:uncharacterized membrane protein AbrB (regulator of aidB expression)